MKLSDIYEEDLILASRQVTVIPLLDLFRLFRFNTTKLSLELEVTRKTLSTRILQARDGAEWLLQIHKNGNGDIVFVDWFNGNGRIK